MDQDSVAQVEAAFLRIPEVRAARMVVDDAGKPVEVHIVASGEKSPKQLVRDIQTVSLANFGLDLDHRIVSVVQFPNGSGDAAVEVPTMRASISEISTETRGTTSRVRVVLDKDGLTSAGEASGITSGESLQRIAALATLDAIKGLLTNGTWIGFDTVSVQRIGNQDVALATVTLSGGPGSLNLSGSAVVTAQQTDAVARAVLDAVNRRLWRG